MKEEAWQKRLASEKPQKPRVLVCDDDDLMLRNLKMGLERLGNYEVITKQCGPDFADAQELAAILAQVHPNAVITDYEMPSMTGMHVGEAVKHYSPNVPVIMHSNAKGNLPPDKELQGKVDALLLKPVGGGELKAHCEKLHNLIHSALLNGGYFHIFPANKGAEL